MKKRTNRLIFPLQEFQPFTKSVIALCPLFLLILMKPWLPESVLKTPVAFHYPLVLIATWLGGSVPGLLGNIISSIYIFGFLKPELFQEILTEPGMRMRAITFYSSTLSFLVIVYAFEKALKKAENAIKQRDEFLSMVSHELRTPITAIKLNIAVVKDQLKNKFPQVDRPLNSIERSANRQEKLISSMLDLAMLESGHLGIRKEECHLNDIVSKAVQTASESMNFTDIQMNLTPVIANCDKTRVEQVIFNLVHNAIKYGEQSTVHVSLEVNDTQAIIKIKSHGNEIKDHKNIFEKFARPTLNSQVQGLGLGLYLSRHLIELHEGKLELTSSNKNGTTFTILFPC